MLFTLNDDNDDDCANDFDSGLNMTNSFELYFFVAPQLKSTSIRPLNCGGEKKRKQMLKLQPGHVWS